MQKQVKKNHYTFCKYMSKARWNSVWHQIDEICRLNPGNVLEIGPGPGIFKMMAGVFGFHVETMDLDPDLQPDHIGSATTIPFDDSTYDVVCAFQMLEHLPYESALDAFREITRVSKRYVVISLPDAKKMRRIRLYIPFLGVLDRLFPRLRLHAEEHVFDGQHYWEINKKNFELERILIDFGEICFLTKTYRVLENPYHRFFLFDKYGSHT